MAQYERPDSTVTAGSWTVQGGPSALWDCIDEASFSDTDFIRTTGVGESACEIGLSNVTDPGVHTGHIVRFRMRSAGSGGAENLNCQLYQGTTLIAASGNQTNRSGTFAAKSFTLTEAEAGNITDYTDLRLRFVPAHGDTETIDVSWAELEVPNVAQNYTMNAEPGSYSITGAAATILAVCLLNAQAGSYALSGADATLPAAYQLDAGAGSYSLSGAAVTTLYETTLINMDSWNIQTDLFFRDASWKFSSYGIFAPVTIPTVPTTRLITQTKEVFEVSV